MTIKLSFSGILRIDHKKEVFTVDVKHKPSVINDWAGLYYPITQDIVYNFILLKLCII